MCDLSAPHFHDPELARKRLEAIRWPDGPVCPHCGQCEKVYALNGKATRPGTYKCANCRKLFSVTVGTLFERSHVPLNKWLMASHLMAASKKGISSHQLHRMLGVTYKTAWFMTHRLREAMKDPVFTTKLGGKGGMVEADETFWGNKKPRGQKQGRGYAHKEKVFSLIDRATGEVRSFHVARVNAETLLPIMKKQIAADTHIATDEASQYLRVGKHFSEHGSVNHSAGEYVRGQIHRNRLASYFSIFKRGLVGTFHHVGPQHLRSYVGEFDFKHNNRTISDVERAVRMLQGIEGKRLMYRDSSWSKAG